MPLTPAERKEFNRLLFYLVATSWSQYRSLLAVLEHHGLGPAERLEAEAAEWRQAHSEELDREALARLHEFLDRAREVFGE